MIPFLIDFEDENNEFKSALKYGANDCFLFDNSSFKLDFDVRNMDLWNWNLYNNIFACKNIL